MDMAKRIAFGVSDWAEYVEFRIRSGLRVEEGFTLSMLEMEVPFQRLGFETFAEFLKKEVPKVEDLVKGPFNAERSFVAIDSSGELKLGSRVIWFGADSTTFKGTVKWLGAIERILCAGVFTDEKVGSPFPIVWKSKRLFYTPPGHSLILRVNELILKSDYAQRQTSMLSRTLSRLMRKVSIRERPRESNIEDSAKVDPQKLLQFDVIYPFAVDSGPNGLKTGDAVLWSNQKGTFSGIVKWLGHLSCQSGLTVGIEFNTPVGNSNGNYEGHKLFECAPNHGKFLCVGCVRKSETSRLPVENGLMSTPTFDFTNQDLSFQWHRNQPLPRQFEVGDTVLYQRDSNSYYTGRVEWLGDDGAEMAGIRFDSPGRSAPSVPDPIPIDCPPGVSSVVPIGKLVAYNRVVPERNESPPTVAAPLTQTLNALAARRLSNRNRTHNPTGRASHEWFPQKGIITPCIQPERLKKLIGYKRGVQGRNNSSHMDALLFAIFSCSETFDKILLQTQETDPLTVQILKEILRSEVANRLRRKFYCPATNVQAVAQVFSSCEQIILPGKSDQILETLLNKMKVGSEDSPSFVSYSNGTESYVHRIIASASNLSENVITVQNLLETDMKLQNQRFQKYPNPALILVLPERNEDLAPSKLFIPNLSLNLVSLVSVVTQSSPEPSSPCTLCGETSSTECADCDDLVVSDAGSDSSASVFCSQCFDAFHQHWTRRSHSKKLLDPSAISKSLELQSIICTRENQSIAFVRCGDRKNGEWIVHDSVCNGASPQVQNVFSLSDCLSSLEKDSSSVLKDWDSFIPEVKIILSFAHMCIYAAAPDSSD